MIQIIMSQTRKRPRVVAVTARSKVHLPLTVPQARVLRFIVRSILETMRAPTIREIGAHVGISSPNGVYAHLTALIKKGYLVGDAFTWNSFRPAGLTLLPVYGDDEAGRRLAQVMGVASQEERPG